MRPGRCTSLVGPALAVVVAGPFGPARAQGVDPFPVVATDACATTQWLIPFAEGSADLGGFAQKRLDALVAAWRIDAGPVLASGRVDGTEERQDAGLSRRRLQVVADALTRRGVPEDAIWTRDEGGGHGFTANRPGIPEPQNRIVFATLARGGEHCARDLAKARRDWLVRNCAPSHPRAGAASCDDALSRLD